MDNKELELIIDDVKTNLSSASQNLAYIKECL